MNRLDKLSEIVENSESYKKIMDDGVVEDHEVEEQAKLVSDLFDKLEKKLSPEDFSLVAKCMAELSVLHAVYRVNQSHM